MNNSAEKLPDMLSSLLSRPTTAKLFMAVFTAAQMLGWITCAQAQEPAVSAAPAQVPPLPKAPPEVRRALREFDRFLDHHALLENRLRIDPPLTANKAFLDKNPELRDFLQANPGVMDGLKTYPLYFLNRALLLQANVPLSFSQLAPFKDLFQADRKLEQELTRSPQSIRDPVFVGNHAALGDFFLQHPDLAQVFQPPPVPPKPQ
jgi:hypothetical protein